MPKISLKPGTLLSPVPAVLVTCGTLEKPNILTIAWTGIVNTVPPMTYISVRPQRHSYPILCESREFAINLTTQALCRAADYCGVKSGADTDKLEKMKLSVEPAQKISAPILTQSPVSLECRVTDIRPLGSHDMFLAEIVAVNVDETLLDKSGKLDLGRAGLLAYVHGEYYALGEKLGTFGYSVRKKPEKSPRRGAPPKRRRK